MSRRKPKVEHAPEVILRNDDRIVRQTRRYKLITPLFGGGAEPQKPDAVTVVRGSEIRGQLRFWWRATRGGQFGDVATLRRAEEAIWGSAAAKDKPGPSRVVLHTTILNRGRPFQAVNRKGKTVKNIGNLDSIYSYVAFPLRDVPDATVLEGVEFELTLQFPREQSADVEAALWAWETFGGIGARTRRGFGALQLVTLQQNGQNVSLVQPVCGQVDAWLRKQLATHLAGDDWPEYVPHLTPNLEFRTTSHSQDPLSAWRRLVDRLQEFRQKRHKRYGISLWPEANVIRKRHGISLKWPNTVQNPHLADKFPRGQFGLPIIFHMPHDTRALPKDSFTLQGKPQADSGQPIDRLASPLILRPLACRDGAVGLAVILATPRVPPSGLEVAELPAGKRDADANLTPQEARSEPLERVLKGETDVLKAFLNTL